MLFAYGYNDTTNHWDFIDDEVHNTGWTTQDEAYKAIEIDAVFADYDYQLITATAHGCS